MAWSLLPTNYTDAVWNGLKKYNMINNSDGTVSFNDMTVYTGKENSFFGAKDANKMNETLNHIISMLENGNDLTAISSPSDSNLLLIHDGTSLKKITFNNLRSKINEPVNNEIAFLLYSGAGAHNSVYRGKSLGTSVTTAQYNAINSGTFDDLYIGDYWTIDDAVYRIAAFDYYLRCGDSDLTTHHAVIVPDSNMYSMVMNNSDTTVGGYVGSRMYTTTLGRAKATIKTAFAGHVLKHRIYLVNAVSNGKPSGGAWCDSEVDLMNEQMVYGGAIFSPVSDGNTVPSNYCVEKSQLPLFRYRPDMISNRNWFWLRDVVSGNNFANVGFNGLAHYSAASTSIGVRPAFCIS